MPLLVIQKILKVLFHLDVLVMGEANLTGGGVVFLLVRVHLTTKRSEVTFDFLDGLATV
jgi:hypothetical protein